MTTQSKPKKMIKSKEGSHPYRIDIDGLRGYAVLFVVIFHTKRQYMPGGYIGVDIFFVISGYLISGIIYREYIKTGSFSYANFYTRRIKRIFPALIVLLVINMIVMCVYLGPQKLKAQAWAVIATTFMSSNFEVLWKAITGDPTIWSTFVVACWSLGVEEQFYIIMPFIAGFIMKMKSSDQGVRLLFVLIFASFASNIIISSAYGNFYSYLLPFTRFWQLLAGCLLAFWQVHHSQNQIEDVKKITSLWQRTATLDGILSLIGFLMMIGSGLFLSDNTSYPNWMGLFPTIGTVLVIRTSIGFVNEILLNNKISLLFGKISYSLYLFHNPFLFYSGFFLSRSVDLGIAFLITLIVTKFIEEKVRVSRWKPMVWILSGIMLFILMIATLIYVYPSKWSYGTF